jgi:hypothetical protein
MNRKLFFELDWRHWALILGVCVLLVSNQYWKDMYDKKDTFCDAKVAAAIARTNPANETVVFIVRNMSICTPAWGGKDYGQNCQESPENLTWVLGVYSK